MKKNTLRMLGLMVLVLVMVLNTETTKADYPYCYNQAASDTYIYEWEWMLEDGFTTEAAVYDAIAYKNYLTPQGVITFVERGNIPSYVDELIAVGRLPQGYVVGNSSTTTPPVEQSTPVTPTTPIDTTPTLDESKAGIYVVINEDVKSYETYNKETVVDTWTIGTHADVKGLMSNGYYKVVKAEKEQYIDKGNLVPLDKYEAAWEEIERVDSTCGTAGSITYTNTISSETKTEALEPLEHDYKIIDQTAPTCTKEGLKTVECSVCGDRKSEKILATGHTAETKIITKEETFFETEATQTRCALCDEIISQEISKIKTKNICFVFGAMFVLCLGVIIIKKKNI